MVLVPEQTLEGLQQREKIKTTPLTSRLNLIDHQMDELISNPGLSDQEKVKMYSQKLQNYLNYYDQRKDAPLKVKLESSEKPKSKDSETELQTEKGVEEKVDDSVEKDIIRALPKTLKTRGQLLIDKIRQHPEIIKWDKRGQMIVEDRPLLGSHIGDLVGDFLRERKGVDPLGWQMFAKGLAKMNAPEDLVRNERRRGALREFKTRLGETDIGDSSVWNPTPPPSEKSVLGKKRRHKQLPTPPKSGKTPAMIRSKELPRRWLTFAS